MRRLAPIPTLPILLSALMLAIASISCTAVPGNTASTATALANLGGAGISVVFVAPDNNSAIAEGATITFAVSATNPNGGIGKIDFNVDDQPVGSQSAPTAGQTSFTAKQTWIAAGIQGHFVQAIASDTNGKSIGDAKIAITVVTAPLKVAANSTATDNTTNQSATIPPTNTPNNAPQATNANAPQIAPQSSPTSAAPKSGVTLSVKVSSLNVRSGDKAGFPAIGTLKLNDTATVIGRNTTGTWWYIQKDPMQGWVINDPTLDSISGDTSTLAVVKSPPTPIPTVPPTNAVAPTSTLGAYPDLVIDSITLNPSMPTANQTFNAVVVIRNAGTVDAGTSLAVGVFQPGSETSPVAVPAIKVGQSATVTMPVTLHSSGTNQTATITIDKNNDVAEGSIGEANNSRTISYTVN